MNQTANNRLYFLDWIRIFAFCVLIFYHTGMYYVTWGWHVKSPYASDAIEPLMLLSSPWRLGLLFMISGVATAFMLQKVRVGALLRQRSWRLLVPLVFGMLAIVPPQSYFEVVEKLNYTGGYGEFMRLYVSGYHGFCKQGSCLDLPTWNHLWFVAYLWAYTMVIGGVAALAGAARLRSWSDALGRQLAGWKIIVLPVLALFVARYALAEAFPETHALVNDWYNHAHYFFLFVMGVMLALQNGFWARVDGLRWTSLGLWLFSWAVVVCLHSMPESVGDLPIIAQMKPLLRMIFCLGQWAPILAICGFGHRHLAFDSAKRRYLTEAVFPVYILHQTLIVSMAHWLKPVKLAPGTEGAVLVVLTFAISFGLFEVVRRVPVLRPLFGLGRATSQTSAYAPQAPAAAAYPVR
ncbi:acyltransferase family protein [Duganella vulcania]|uniref:Acyltransferase family protein n=1 Tax=Duganella vulcania TaxID=2692166 RepID=A0A845GKS3_9BURK|nr:acyltransferase family protein [Duganella vulcania]MYM94070.1 acyltransferase family protein [Duganella vulcania]